jgi:DNA polymerase-3 subunit delta
MKFIKLESFEKHVKSASPQRLFSSTYLLIGKDSFTRKQAIDFLLAAFLQGSSSIAHGVKSIEGGQITAEMLQQELEGLPLFQQKQVLLIHTVEKLPKPIQKILEHYLLHPNPLIYLLLSAATLSSTSDLYKKAEKAGVILELEEEKEWLKEKTQTEWVKNQVARHQKQISSQAAQYLVKRVGIDSSLLFNELHKLFSYLGNRLEITIADIEALCVSTPSANIWQLGEAIFYKDTSKALKLMKELLESGTSFFALVRQIRHQFETEFQISSLLETGGTATEVSQLFPYMKGQILDKHMQMARNYGVRCFKQGLLKIDEMELMAKNSSIDSDLLSELLMIHLTSNV